MKLLSLIVCFFTFTINSYGAEVEQCPVPVSFKNLSCSGTVTAKSLADIVAYKNNLGIKKNIAKNLLIDFNLNADALSIATPCSIKISDNKKISATNNLCLHGDMGINIGNSVQFDNQDIRLEANDEITFGNDNKINANNISVINFGVTSFSKIRFGQRLIVDANQMILDSFDKASISSFADINLVDSFGMYVRGDDLAVLGSDSKIQGSRIEIKTTDQLKLSARTKLEAINEVVLNGNKCTIDKTDVITASDKLGNCFLQSNNKNSYTISSNTGFAPLAVTFDTSKIVDAKSFQVFFGDGESLITTQTRFTHTYARSGNYTSQVKFATVQNKKGQWQYAKSAGSIDITVKDKVNLAPTAFISCTTNNLLVSCNGLSSFDPEGYPLNYRFEYSDGFIESNTTGLSSHAFTVAGLATVKLTVTDNLGAIGTSVANVVPLLPPNVLPNLVANCQSLNPYEVTCDTSGSTDSDGTILKYTYSFDGGSNIETSSNSQTYLFKNGGSHTITISATDNDGGVSTISKTVSIKEDTLPTVALTCTSSKPYQVDCSVNATDADQNDSIKMYHFDMGNNVSFDSSSATINYNYGVAGNFNITATATDSYGGVGSNTQSVSVNENSLPIANFNCESKTTQSLTCTSSSTDSDGIIVSTSFVTDDNKVFTQNNFTYKFANDTDHSVTIVVVDDLGGTSTLTKTFSVIKNILPSFDLTTSSTSGIAPLNNLFTVSNAIDPDGSIASISWLLNNEEIGTGTTLSYNFLTEGDYTIIAKVTDNLGGTTSKSVSINVQPAPKIPPKAYFKYFQTAMGDSYVELRLGSNIKTENEIASAYYLIDEGSSLEKKIDLTEFYSDTRNTVDLETLDTHTIKLVVIDSKGLSNSFTHNLSLKSNSSDVAPYPRMQITEANTNTIFVNMNSSFVPDLDASLGTLHLDFGDGHSVDVANDTYYTYKYANAGTYIVTLTTTNGSQTVTTTKEITVSGNAVDAINPNAAFSYNIFSFAQNVTFYNDKSGTPNGSIISYSWNFGDGSTGTGDKIAHFYNPGDYLVTLTVVDTMGKSSSTTKHIYVVATGDDIAMNIDCVDGGVLKASCGFFGLDKFNQLNLLRVNWGDGTNTKFTLPLASPVGQVKSNHTYSAAGTYTMTLTAGTTRGYTRVITKQYTPQAPNPVANITCSAINLTVTCDASKSYDPNGLALTYKFSISDGIVYTSSSSTYTRNLNAEGLQTINLEITNPNGQKGTTTTSINLIAAEPIANIQCITNNLLVSCNGLTSYDPNLLKITSYEFDFGDGSVITDLYGAVTHNYTSAGLYTVSMKVTNALGKQSTVQTLVQALLPPNILPSVDLNCNSDEPYKLTCSTFALDQDGTIASLVITYDDEQFDYSENNKQVFHYFKNSGKHDVTITAIDNDGGINSKTISIDVKENHAPTVSFDCTTDNKPQYLNCYSTSIDEDPNDAIVSYEWDFGDGTEKATSMISPSISHQYATYSTFSVSLKVTDKFGLVSSITKSYAVLSNQLPIASISCINTIGTTYQCNSNASDIDGTIVEQLWKIENQEISGNSIIYNFTNGGLKNVSLFLKDNLGGTNIFSTQILVDLPEVDFQCTKSDILKYTCSLSDKTLTDVKIANYLFIVDDKDISENGPLNIDFSHFGNHKVTLKLTDKNNKTSELVKTMEVPVEYQVPLADFNYEVDNLGNVTLDATDSLDKDRVVQKYIWTINDNVYESKDSVYKTTLTLNSFVKVTLKVVDEKNSSSEVTKNIYIYDPEVPLPDLETNSEGLYGVDSDNNLIRDDVQIWIASISNDDMNLKKTLSAYARNEFNILQNFQDIDKSKTLFKNSEYIYLCLQSQLKDDKRLDEIISIFKFYYQSNKASMMAHVKFESNVSGVTSESISESSDLSSYCSLYNPGI